MPDPDCRESGFDRVCCLLVAPVFGRDGVERQQDVSIVLQAFANRRRTSPANFQKGIERLLRLNALGIDSVSVYVPGWVGASV